MGNTCLMSTIEKLEKISKHTVQGPLLMALYKYSEAATGGLLSKRVF